MPSLMIRNDITKVAADAIVNPANRNLLQGSGTSRAIYQAAGEQELTAACEAIGYCDLGKAVCTPAFRLPAKYIFHAVCPAWQGGVAGEAEQLAGAYHAALELVAEHHCESVAFPLPATFLQNSVQPGLQPQKEDRAGLCGRAASVGGRDQRPAPKRRLCLLRRLQAGLDRAVLSGT